MTPQPLSFASFTAAIDSDTEPIWFTCRENATHIHTGGERYIEKERGGGGGGWGNSLSVSVRLYDIHRSSGKLNRSGSVGSYKYIYI